MTVAEFLQRHPPLAPARRSANADELRKLGVADGVLQLKAPPLEVAERHVPSQKGDLGCHLWVLDRSGAPFILELASVVPPLASGRVKHTNLTGGEPASCGGELWFDPADQDLVYINGCSGRYGPTSPQQLDDAVDVVRSFGLKAESFGWDSDANRPAMALRRESR